MIAQTYCGKEYHAGSAGAVYVCATEDNQANGYPVGIYGDGPCPSCLREHIAKLEARNAELEGLIRSQPGNMPPERTAYLDRSLVGWDIGKELVEEVQALQAKLEAQAEAARINLETAAALDAQAPAQAGGVVVPEPERFATWWCNQEFGPKGWEKQIVRLVTTRECLDDGDSYVLEHYATWRAAKGGAT